MHHNRANYIIQIKTICRESKMSFGKNVVLEKQSDYKLLTILNHLLKLNNCETLTLEELELELY